MVDLFEVRRRFRRSSLRTDKVNFKLGTWRVCGDPHSLHLVLPTFTIQPDYLSEPVRLFQNIRTTRNRRVYEASFFQGRGQGRATTVGALFDGYLQLNPRGDDPIYGPCYQIEARITFNPSRIRAYQPAGGSPDTVLFAARQPAQIDDEFAIDGEDNVIVSVEPGEYQEQDAWIDDVARYAQAINDVLEQAFLQLFHNRDGSSREPRPTLCVVDRPQTTIRLREAEQYLELSDDDPLHMVRQLEPILVTLGSTAYSSTYQLFEPDEDQDVSRLPVSGQLRGNSRSVTVDLPNKTKLVVYAKTNRRVRFEIRNRINRHGAQTLLGGGSSYEGDDWNDQFHTWMERLRDNAGLILGIALTRFWQRGTDRLIEGAPVYEFLARVCDLCEDWEDARMLISILINNRRIVPSALPGPLRQLLNRQAQHVSPVFVRAVPRGPYIEAPRYAASVNWLRAQSESETYLN